MSFVLSKVLWMLLSPATLLLMLLGGGLALEFSPYASLKKSGRILCFFAFFCFSAVAVFPVGDMALAPLENRFALNLPNHVDGIIVLGGDENPPITEARGKSTAFDSLRRYIEFKNMIRFYPEAKLVFSGGSPLLRPNEHVLDSDVARNIMTQIGVPVERVVFEKKSRNTYENAVFSAGLVNPKPSENWLLVTSAWHLPRAMLCFRKAGWNVYPVPAGYFTTGALTWNSAFDFSKQMLLFSMALHEYIGLVSYRLMGRTDALWPE